MVLTRANTFPLRNRSATINPIITKLCVNLLSDGRKTKTLIFLLLKTSSLRSMCYKELDKRFAVVNGKKITKKARIEATVLNSLTPLSKSEICKILPDVSPTTVEAVLGAMVKTGSIQRIGAGRMTRYVKA